MLTYEQSTGELFGTDGRLIGKGYSGFGAFKNDPSKQDQPNEGPIPQGRYYIGPLIKTELHGPDVMRLIARPGTNIFGRAGFLIHGDSVSNPGTASHGCIIMPKDVRLLVGNGEDRELEVVE